MSRLAQLKEKALLARQDSGARVTLAQVEAAGGPGRSGEFRRIVNLTSRPIAMEDEELRVLITLWLRKPATFLSGCPYCGRLNCEDPTELRDAQARAIAECVDARGGLCQLGVGAGKTLTAILIAAAFRLELGIKRSGLLVPSKLVKPFKRAIVAARRHWNVAPDLEEYVIGYSRLSLAGNENLLGQMGLGALIADEAHCCRDRRSARTRRLQRLFKEFPATRYVGLSGTFIKSTPLDYWHLALLALGEDKAPVPKSWPEMQQWAAVVAPEEGFAPLAAGCIPELGEPFDSPPEAFARRVLSTPGIVSTRQASVDASITCSILDSSLPDDLNEAVRSVLSDWEIPGGHVIVDASGMHRAVSQLCLGFWSRLAFKPGDDKEGWYEARRNWARFCREAYGRWSMKLDSELPVINAVKDGRLKDPEGCYAQWCLMRDTIKPWDEVTWINKDWAPELVERWLGKQGGLVWTHWIPAGERIAEALGIPYYGGGTDPEADAPFKSAILSVMAHSEGRNLQFVNRNLCLTMTPKASVWQQLIGRTHRQGQLADNVEVAFYTPVELTRNKIDEARADARWLATQNVEPQKLCMCDWEE